MKKTFFPRFLIDFHLLTGNAKHQDSIPVKFGFAIAAIGCIMGPFTGARYVELCIQMFFFFCSFNDNYFHMNTIFQYESSSFIWSGFVESRLFHALGKCFSRHFLFQLYFVCVCDKNTRFFFLFFLCDADLLGWTNSGRANHCNNLQTSISKRSTNHQTISSHRY